MLVVGPNRLFLALHRAGAAVARRGRRRAGRAGRPRPRRRRPAASTAGSRRAGQGRPAHGRRSSPRPSATASVRCATTSSSASASATCGCARGESAAHRPGRPPPVPQPQRRPPLRRGRGLRRAGRQSAATASAPATVRERLRAHRGGARGARVDVAGAHAGRSCCTTCSARGAAAAWPARSWLDRRRVDALYRPRGRRRRRRSAGPTTTCRCSTRPARCSARAAQAPGPRRRGRRRRRDPHLRPHRRRRGPGPLADAAAHARPPLAQRLDDHRRRHRPVHRRVGPADWDEILAHLPDRRPPRAELTIGYRIPAQHGARGAGAAGGRAGPGAAASIREGGDPPAIIAGRAADGLGRRPSPTPSGELAGRRQRHRGRHRPTRWSSRSRGALTRPASTTARPPATASTTRSPSCRSAWSRASSSTPSSWSSRRASSTRRPQGLRALYVALTRATKRLAIVHAEPLPEVLVE